MWSELGGAARDVVDVVEAQWSRLGRGRRAPWSTWSELGRTARDVVDVVCGRCGRSLVEPLETWLMWSMVDVVGAQWSHLGRGRHELSGAAQSARLARRGSLDGLDVYAES